MSEINFLPLSYRRAESNRRWRVRQGIAVLLACATLTAWWCIQDQMTWRMQMHAAALRAAADAAEDQQGELVRLRAEYEVLLHQAAIRRELGMPVSHSQVLTKLGELLPGEVGLLRLKMVTQRPKPMLREEYQRLKDKPDALKKREQALADQAPPDQLIVEFEAFAPDDLTIAGVVAQLSDSPLFQDVKMHYSRHAEHAGFAGRRFRVSTVVALDRRYVPADTPTTQEVAHVAR